MPRYAAFLRGMNLGGRRISNDALRAHVEALGFEQVALFRASGNVIFETSDRDGEKPAAIARRLEEGLHAALGYDVPVFLRTAAEIQAIAQHEPFDPQLLAASGGKLQVSLLAAKPAAATRKQVLAHATDADRVALHARELYWLPSGGMLDSKLDLNAIDTLLGPSTRRTKGTLDLIAARWFAG